MKKVNYLLFFITIALAFAITGFNFDNFSFEENMKEYTLFIVAIVLGVIYLINPTKISKK